MTSTTDDNLPIEKSKTGNRYYWFPGFVVRGNVDFHFDKSKRK